MRLESLLQYLEGYLSVSAHPDYPTALNGLQVEAGSDVHRIAVAVDTSIETIEGAVAAGADLLIVHHGLFWPGLQPLTGRLVRKVRALLDDGLSLYACHLPLDGHAEVGNSALLARAMGVEPTHRFGEYKGAAIGWYGVLPEPVAVPALQSLVERAVEGPAHVIAGGPARVQRIGVVTGGGASFLEEAARVGLDAFVTGEGPHHTHVDAMELGIHVVFAGHYATETFGVRALAAHLAERFDLPWEFIDRPTSL